MRHRGIIYLVAAARKIWRWSDERRQVKKRCSIGGAAFKCDKCSKETEDIDIDHIDPIGKQPIVWIEFGPWLERLFCAASNLQGLCKDCHKEKTNLERKERAAKAKGARKCKTGTRRPKKLKKISYVSDAVE